MTDQSSTVTAVARAFNRLSVVSLYRHVRCAASYPPGSSWPAQIGSRSTRHLQTGTPRSHISDARTSSVTASHLNSSHHVFVSHKQPTLSIDGVYKLTRVTFALSTSALVLTKCHLNS